MRLTDKLEILMKQHGLNKRTLSMQSGIPYTTIVGLFSKGYENAKMSTLNGLSNFFGVTLDSLCRDDLDELVYKKPKYAPSLNEAESQLLTDFDQLNEQGQRKVCDYAADLVSSGKYKKSSFPGLAENA